MGLNRTGGQSASESICSHTAMGCNKSHCWLRCLLSLQRLWKCSFMQRALGAVPESYSFFQSVKQQSECCYCRASSPLIISRKLQLCPWLWGGSFSKENSWVRWTHGEGQTYNPEQQLASVQSEDTVVAVWHSYVFFSLCQDLNNLPWGARTKKNREDGDQGSLQEDTNMIAKRGEKNCCYMQKLFSILFRSKFSLVSEITLNMWQSPLLFWQKLLFLLSSLSGLFSFCWFLHLARLISCQGLLLSLLPLWSSQDL